jgi:hypothetical protein
MAAGCAARSRSGALFTENQLVAQSLGLSGTRFNAEFNGLHQNRVVAEALALCHALYLLGEGGATRSGGRELKSPHPVAKNPVAKNKEHDKERRQDLSFLSRFDDFFETIKIAGTNQTKQVSRGDLHSRTVSSSIPEVGLPPFDHSILGGLNPGSLLFQSLLEPGFLTSDWSSAVCR